MKTQVSILVEKESLLSRGISTGFSPIIALAKRKDANKINILLDDQELTLAASNEPYVFDVEPGEHALLAADFNGGKKKISRAAGRAAGRAFLAAISGESVLGAIADSMEKSADRMSNDEADGGTFTLEEGETAHFVCKPTAKGTVDITYLG